MGLNPERCWEVDPKPLVRRRSSPRRRPPCEGGWCVTRDHMASALLRARCGGTTLGQGPVGGSLGSWMKEQPLGSGSAYAAPPHLPRPPARPRWHCAPPAAAGYPPRPWRPPLMGRWCQAFPGDRQSVVGAAREPSSGGRTSASGHRSSETGRQRPRC